MLKKDSYGQLSAQIITLFLKFLRSDSVATKDPFAEDDKGERDGVSAERTRTRSWGDWVEEEESDKPYQPWLEETEPIK